MGGHADGERYRPSAQSEQCEQARLACPKWRLVGSVGGSREVSAGLNGGGLHLELISVAQRGTVSDGGRGRLGVSARPEQSLLDQVTTQSLGHGGRAI
jgi:hypothetical protein